jgi:hypothetical protein
VPVEVWALVVLRKCLVKEIRQLEKSRRNFHADELIEQLQEIGKKAFKTFVVEDKAARLG